MRFNIDWFEQVDDDLTLKNKTFLVNKNKTFFAQKNQIFLYKNTIHRKANIFLDLLAVSLS